MQTAGWSPYLGWLGSSTQMGRDSPIKRGLDLLGVASIKRGLDLLGVASGQHGVDEKELQRRRSGGEKELRR
jgi:hypothetical protein